MQQQNHTTDTLLDLRGLAEPDLLVIDRSGTEWPIPASVPLRTALELQALWQQAAQDEHSTELDLAIDYLAGILRLRRPQCSREDVLDAFSVAEAQRLVEWISFRLAGQAQTNGSQPGTAVGRQGRRAATRKQTSSPRASEAAN